MHRKLKAALCLLSLVVSLAGIAAAQTRGTSAIVGKVVDQDGTPLPGVSIVVTSPNLMGNRAAASDEEGQYRFTVLPIGTYSLEATLQGFNTVQKTNIVLHTGITATIPIEMTPAAQDHEIVVQGVAPLIDLQDTGLSKTVITKELLTNVPTSRNLTEIFAFASGSQGNYSYGGSRASNSYQLDGVELVDAWYGSGVYTAPIDYEVVEEVEILGLGAPAEYGNFTGSVANIITKSGGNTLSADLQFYYKSFDWHSKDGINKSDPYWALVPNAPVSSLTDPSFHLGGPIIKDKLWFFTGVEYYLRKERITALNKTLVNQFPKFFAKLTYQLDEKNKFQTFFEVHNNKALDRLTSAFYAPEVNEDFLTPTYMGNLNFLHMFSPSTFLEFKVAGYTMDNVYNPSQGKDVSGHYDVYTGMYTRNVWWNSLWQASRIGTSLSLTTHVDDFILGSHDIKVGFEFERSHGAGQRNINGGIMFQDYDGQPYRARAGYTKQDAFNNRFSFYAQDSWKISESLVLNPGLRVDIIRGTIPDADGSYKAVYKPTGVGPRIGFIWDVFKNHKTAVKAHYGRYQEGTKTYNFAQASAEADDIYYSVGPNWVGLTELYRIKPDNLYSIDPNIKHPSMDQFAAGIEHVLGSDITVKMSYVYKKWFNFVEPVDTGRVFVPVSYTDPETKQVITVYDCVNPAGSKYFITNPEKGKDIGAAYPGVVSVTPERKYQAFEIGLTKRFSNRWQLATSYVYSHEEGTYSSSSLLGMSSQYLDPNNQIFGYGEFASSVPHIFKVQGTYVLPLDINLSGFFVFLAGSPWGRTIPVKLTQGSVNIRTEPVGDRRLPSYSNMDLRLEKSFSLGAFRLSVLADVFNLFNEVIQINVYSLAGANFGKPTKVTASRTIRLGLKISY